MPLQALVFILLFGLIQGGLMLIILLHRRNIKPFHIFLSAYIATILFQITLKTVSKIWVMQIWGTGYSLSYYLPFLYGPLAYFIAYASVGNYTFKPKHILHFSPFLLFVVLFSLDSRSVELPEFMDYLFSPFIRLILQFTSLLTYHLMAKRLLSDFCQGLKASLLTFQPCSG